LEKRLGRHPFQKSSGQRKGRGEKRRFFSGTCLGGEKRNPGSGSGKRPAGPKAFSGAAGFSVWKGPGSGRENIFGFIGSRRPVRGKNPARAARLFSPGDRWTRTCRSISPPTKRQKWPRSSSPGRKVMIPAFVYPQFQKKAGGMRRGDMRMTNPCSKILAGNQEGGNSREPRTAVGSRTSSPPARRGPAFELRAPAWGHRG